MQPTGPAPTTMTVGVVRGAEWRGQAAWFSFIVVSVQGTLLTVSGEPGDGVGDPAGIEHRSR